MLILKAIINLSSYRETLNKAVIRVMVDYQLAVRTISLWMLLSVRLTVDDSNILGWSSRVSIKTNEGRWERSISRHLWWDRWFLWVHGHKLGCILQCVPWQTMDAQERCRVFRIPSVCDIPCEEDKGQQLPTLIPFQLLRPIMLKQDSTR